MNEKNGYLQKELDNAVREGMLNGSFEIFANPLQHEGKLAS